MNRRIGERLRGRWALTAAVLAIGGLLAAGVSYRLAVVVGDSMRPGLRTGDIIVVDKRAYRNTNPERGDLVLARHHRELIVKRVVGLPGEEVALHRGRVVLNGAIFNEPYAVQEGALEILPGTLFRGKYAIVGDNRSLDVSESVHAVVSKEGLLGKVVWRWRLLGAVW